MKALMTLAITIAAAFFVWYFVSKPSAAIVYTLDPSTQRYTTTGPVIGVADGEQTYAWLGIPYAAPPTGQMRWRAPRLAEPWTTVREGNTFGNPCVQLWGPLAGFPGDDGEVVGSEDCLFLNVWAPRSNADDQGELLPVMLWIHGGGNTIGTGNSYSGKYLSGRQKLIFVSINYRLGIFGWLSHTALKNTATSASDASGNFGNLDMIAALKWVQSNIASFGGNPDNVTIFGESAGGRDVYALMASPLAKGMFHRAIVQSGGLGTTEHSRAENYTDDNFPGEKLSSNELIAKQWVAAGKAESRQAAKVALSSVPDADVIAFMRGRSPQQLLSGVSGGAGMYRVPQNFRDGHVLPKGSLLKLLSYPGRYNSVPLMVGTNRDEQKLFMAQDPKMVEQRFGFLPRVRDIETYNRVAAYYSDRTKALSVDEPAARIKASSGKPVYAYRWDWDEGSSNWLVDYSVLIGAGHLMEVPFIFNDFDGAGWIPGFYNEENIPGRDMLSAQMMSYWSEFAYSGAPGKGRSGELPQWSAWGASRESLMILDSAADGGVRMSAQEMTVAKLKHRLRGDDKFPTTLSRCRTYAKLFLLTGQTKDFWDEREYRDLGCVNYDPYAMDE